MSVEMANMLSVLANPATLLCGAVVVLSWLWWWSTRRHPDVPPGPGAALPILGHLHLVSKDPCKKMLSWWQKYGDVFSLYMGTRLVVVLNGYETIKEALVKHGEVFSDRPSNFITELVAKNKGVANSSGQTWKEQRKISLEILRELGMGKNVLAEKIQEEVQEYIKVIASHEGQSFDLGQLTNVSVSNNICSVVFGKRFEYEDKVFTDYIKRINQNIQSVGNTAVMTFFPQLRYLPGDLFNLKRTIANVRLVQDIFIDPLLKEHLKTYTEGSADDFIYSYIREIRKNQSDGKINSINEENLSKVIGDLFVAGTETTTTMILWSLLYFLHYPQVQEKCFQEIKRVVGTERSPSLRDKPELTYFDATILELLRMTCIVPLGVQHGLSHDTTFRGYRIPKDAIIIPSLVSVLHHEDIWGDPYHFRPERFIGPDGKLTKQDQLIPFGIGRRVCIGEALARMELFLYLANLIQNFRFLPPEDGPLPPLEGTLGIVYTPNRYKIRAVPRDQI